MGADGRLAGDETSLGERRAMLMWRINCFGLVRRTAAA